MKSTTKILGTAAAVYLAVMGAESLSAKAAWVKQAKEQLNDRGKWLVAQMAKHNAKEVDVTWLKDYPGGKD